MKKEMPEYVVADTKEVELPFETNFFQKLNEFRLQRDGVLVAKRYLEIFTEFFKRYRVPATAVSSFLECMFRNWNDVMIQRNCAVYNAKERRFKPITDKTENEAFREAIIFYMRPNKDFERENAKCFEKKEKNKRKRKVKKENE